MYDSARRQSPFVEEFRSLLRYSELIRQLILRSIKTRYKRSILGIAWTMINPLLTMAVLTLVFSRLFQFPTRTYALHVLSGLLIWNFFAQTSLAAMGEMMWSGSLLGRIYVPKTAFAVGALGTGLVNLVLAVIPYLVISLLLGVIPPATLLLLPVPVLFTGLFTLGVGLALSSMVLYFQDIQPTYEILLAAWFYLTPVIYPVGLLPAGLAALLKWNPMFHYVELFRSTVLTGSLPGLASLTAQGLFGLAVFVLGWWIFTRRARDYAYQI
ncbi:MAG: ABC transporter permease [Anaerolineales bacterium]|nr:ABC transporter permease [Anaerolineales bacterium]